MRPNYLSFLYQTRTLQQACRRSSPLFTHRAAFATSCPLRSENLNPNQKDSSIPFQWETEQDLRDHGDSVGENKPATLTPMEDKVFKAIFAEISEGRMPKPRKRIEKGADASADADADADATGSSDSMVDQARKSETGVDFLQRFPSSLRSAAEVALGKFELAPKRPILSGMIDLEKEEAAKMAEWKKYEDMRVWEKKRVERLMSQCRSDFELWKVMEEHVFSLPLRLGITEKPPRKRKSESKASKTPKKSPNGGRVANDQKREKERLAAMTDVDHWEIVKPQARLIGGSRAMDVHGPLYPDYLAAGLEHLDTSFDYPSPLVFNIIPRAKALGLPSYVLGVSTKLFNKLAEIHWNRYGDVVSALETLEEMQSVNLWADHDTKSLLTRIHAEIHACTWGAQGEVVMALTEAPPFDGTLDGRIQKLEQYVNRSFREQGFKEKEKVNWEDEIVDDEEEEARWQAQQERGRGRGERLAL